MEEFLRFSIFGLVTAAIYAVAASGLVVTYTTSGIFNFAHGAFGMMAAFVYWQFRFEWGWAGPVALVAMLFIVAPLFGALVERYILRGLQDVSEVTKLVVSVSLLFGVYQGANIVFDPNVGRRFPGFFDGNSIDLGVVNLPWHDAITIVAALVVAVLLRFLLFGTRTGVSMRAVVDDRPLSQLSGSRPDRAALMAWAIGASLAALSGILLAGSQGSLKHLDLTLLVINAYAAAMIGRLRSLPLTFLGALILGLGESYAVGYLPTNQSIESIFGFNFTAISLSGLRPAFPVILLFLILLFLPPLRVRAGGQQKSREYIPMPPIRRWLVATAALAGVAWLAAALISDLRVFHLGIGMAYAIIMLSLVPLTGWGGQINLAPLAFAGIGAVVMGHFGGDGTLWGLLLAAVVTGIVGAVVALPALRLQGLYLALATAAFAVFMDRMFFNQRIVLPNGSLNVPRLELFGISFEGNKAHLVLLAVVFGLVGLFLVWLRQGEFARRLLAMKASPAACVTLGMSLTRTKVQVFALSAAIAGLGGALLGAQRRSIAPDNFFFLESLPVVLLAVVGGIAAVGGALFGGLTYAFAFFIIPDLAPSLKDLLALGPAFAGISLGRNPNGAVNETVKGIKEKQAVKEAAARGEEELGEPDWDRMGLDEPFTKDDRDQLDRALALDEEPLYGAARS
ncbi:MAG TPA: ABC transporter permease [Acidimicrobiales bacterium]|nr:ABC transporter permease [Acidimicrobiales bacterium]